MITFNAAISACERGDQWQMALLLLKEMDEKRSSVLKQTGSERLSLRHVATVVVVDDQKTDLIRDWEIIMKGNSEYRKYSEYSGYFVIGFLLVDGGEG